MTNGLNTAATFEDYYAALRNLYPVPVEDPARLLDLADIVAADYPTVDLWAHIYEVLQHTMRGCTQDDKFTMLFAHNLRERLRRESARQNERKKRERLAGKCHQQLLQAHNPVTPVDETYRHWSALLLDQVVDRIDALTRDYLVLRFDGKPVKHIALALGVSEGTLRNRYGSEEKLSRAVMPQVQRLVLDLPAGHRKLLGRHLDKTGLSPREVKRLFGVALIVDRAVPYLQEQALLATLGWAYGIFSRKFGEFGFGREYGSRSSQRRHA